MNRYATDRRGRLLHVGPEVAVEEILLRSDLPLGPIHVQHYAMVNWGWDLSRGKASTLLRDLAAYGMASKVKTGRYKLYLHHTRVKDAG